MSRKNIISVLCLTICGLLPLKSEAEVRLSPLFGDGMVLQQRSSVPIFGSAVRGETVIVKTGWDGREYSTSADETGRFIIYVKTPEAGGPYSLTINGRTVLNVMSGEVWLCSGQSNMQFTLAASDMSEVNGECLDNVRIFTVPIQSRREPVAELTSGRWHFGDVDSIKTKVSAVAYYFARSLHAETGVPVGIISSSR